MGVLWTQLHQSDVDKLAAGGLMAMNSEKMFSWSEGRARLGIDRHRLIIGEVTRNFRCQQAIEIHFSVFIVMNPKMKVIPIRGSPRLCWQPGLRPVDPAPSLPSPIRWERADIHSELTPQPNVCRLPLRPHDGAGRALGSKASRPFLPRGGIELRLIPSIRRRLRRKTPKERLHF